MAIEIGSSAKVPIEIGSSYDGAYLVTFDENKIHTTFTASGDTVGAWVDEIYRVHRRRLSRLVIGLDVEWRASRSSAAAAASPPPALLQLCVGRRCLVLQILRADYLPDALFDFLADARFTFVGAGIQAGAARLWAEYGFSVARAVDLGRLAAVKLGNPALRGAGLQARVWEVMGLQVDKPDQVRMSAWDARRLTKGQLKYACADAFASFEVGRRLYDGEY
ncbi:hypothetical protein HU200_012051 [Digitaria exilis]|uniref:3'-5' exonuclease domain-containing protein n=1 Tax=Digitaria exilis TaxID=1010633 RepID=A0A835FG16_9POAL|nr:hypothetical protein HU200_012051 [Digitaria exilis]CAB3474185.1 unnamed protein product [Digitaria exilis]